MTFLNDLDIIFVTDYYDIPICGLCMHEGRVERFELEDFEEAMYNIVPLTASQRFFALVDKKLFEMFVGLHWSYDKPNKRYHYRPQWCWGIYYKVLQPLGRLFGIRE